MQCLSEYSLYTNQIKKIVEVPILLSDKIIDFGKCQQRIIPKLKLNTKVRSPTYSLYIRNKTHTHPGPDLGNLHYTSHGDNSRTTKRSASGVYVSPDVSKGLPPSPSRGSWNKLST